VRQIRFHGKEFLTFYEKQDFKVQTKIEFVLDLVRHQRNVPKKFLKKLVDTNDLFEIRVITTFKNIRIICFFDGATVVVLLNSFQKKDQKLPKKELKRAERMKSEYLTQKCENNERD
jgi:hypothetical protein